MKKTMFAVLFFSLCSVFFLLTKGERITAFAAVELNTKVEEVTAETAGSVLSAHINPYDGCDYYKVTLEISGNSSATAFSGTGVSFYYDGSYFEAVADANEHVYIERGAVADDVIFSTTVNVPLSLVAVASAGSNTTSCDSNGDIYSFLLKTKENVIWTDQSEIITDVVVSKWINNNNVPIPFSSPQFYLHVVTRIIGDLNGDGETDVQDVQLLNAALYDGFLNIPYTDEVSSYSAHITIFSNCTNMIVTVAGTTYVILGMADADQNNYINSGDASAFLQYYTDSLAQLDTGDYIGCPYTFYIEIPYTA